jgi:hypothetical protein
MLRVRNWATDNPRKAWAGLFTIVVGSFLWEARVTHNNRVPSPYANTHLEYELKDQPSTTAPSGLQRVKAVSMSNAAVTSSAPHLALPQSAEEEARRKHRAELAKAASGYTKTEYGDESNGWAAPPNPPEGSPAFEESGKHTTLMVGQGHLQARSVHWNVRNHERNWSILAQDQQKQKDDYHYRLERSRDDDFGRLATRDLTAAPNK